MTDVGRTQQGVRRYCSCSEIVWRAFGASIRNLSPTIFIAIAIIAYAVLATDSFARDALGTVELSKAFDFGKGEAVLCYKEKPAFVFASSGSTAESVVKLVTFEGDQKELYRRSGKLVPGTLSCSDDSATIAAVFEEPPHSFTLLILKDGSRLKYKLSDLANWPGEFPFEGYRALLSGDGRSIALPATPTHVQGPDVLLGMQLFVYESGKSFFLNGSLLHDQDDKLESLSFKKGAWSRNFVISKSRSLFLQHAGVCMGRTIALAGGDESTNPEKIYDLSDGTLKTPDWPGASRFLGRIRAVGSDIVAGASFERCVYAIERWASSHFDLKGIATADLDGTAVYAVPRDLAGNGEETTFANHRIGITKDGCRVLASTYVRQPQANEDWQGLGQRTVILRLRGAPQFCS